jgi:hypothetical protein
MSGSWLFNVLSQHLPGMIEENHDISQDRRYLDRIQIGSFPDRRIFMGFLKPPLECSDITTRVSQMKTVKLR